MKYHIITAITRRRLGIVVALAALYFIVGKLGLQLAFINNSTSAVWPATGLALAALLLFGADLWPGVALGAFLVNLTTAGAVFPSLAIAFGNTLEIVFAVYLVQKYARGRNFFENEGDMFRFAMIGFLSATVAAAIGTISLLFGGLLSLADAGPVWFTWLLGDAAGMLIFTPFFMLWAGGGSYRWRREDGTAAGGLLLYILVATITLVGHALPVPLSLYPFAALIALVIPPLIWAAFRFGRRITASATVFLSIVAVVSTLNDPHLGTSAAAVNDALLFLQLFVSAISVFMLMFAITIYRQRKGERALANNERHFRSLVENSSDGILLMDMRGMIQYVSPAVRHIVGYAPEDLTGKHGREFIFIDDRAKYDSFVENLVRHPRVVAATLEIRAIQKDGTPRWLEFAAVNLLDDPSVEAVVVNFRDITERKEVATAKNNFISSVSYRLSPPLAQAETYIAALQERKRSFTPLEQKYLAELDEANQKMILLTGDIIRLARIELGTINTSPKVIDLRKLVDEALRAAAPVAQAKKIGFVWKHPPARTLLTADANLLGLVLQRLVAKFMALVGEKAKINIVLARDGDMAGDSVGGTPAGVTLRFSSSEIIGLRKQLQMGVDDVSFGFYIIQSLVELMGGGVHFEPGADGGEALVMAFPASGAAVTVENRNGASG